MNPQEEKDLLSYLEGEIKYDKESGKIWAESPSSTTHLVDVRGWSKINHMFKTEKETIEFFDSLGEFAATALINERERRKNEVFKPLENWENKPITPKKEE